VIGAPVGQRSGVQAGREEGGSNISVGQAPQVDSPRSLGISGGMSDELFQRFSRYIQSDLGIKMPPAKKTMLQARLQKRLRHLGMKHYEEYFDYVFSSEGLSAELDHMIDVVTTNKTDFFREPRHFDFLTRTVLLELYQGMGKAERSRMRFWSAGCSTGEEPYTLAMVLSEFKARREDFNFSILATDISTRVLRTAMQGIYTEEDVAPVPIGLKRKYLLRSKDPGKALVRIVPELRRMVRFGRLNFMSEDYGIQDTMQVIFCRNVIIYFDKSTQEQMLNRLCSHLMPGGYLFMGHSETLSGLKVPLRQVASTIYRKA
jgi:chemotaxis protein methyltransferase CheR